MTAHVPRRAFLGSDRPTLPPPQNLEAERAVLGAALLDAAAVPVALGVRTLDFHSERNRVVHQAIQALVDRSEPVDSLLVASELDQRGQLEDAGGHAHLAVLVEEAASAVNVATYARLIVEAAQKRALVRIGHEVATSALNGQPSRAILNRLHHELAELGPDPATAAAPAVVDVTEILARHYLNRPSLVAGILERGTLAVVGGAPKLGKSALVLGQLLCGATERPWLGFLTTRSRALLFQAEIPEPQLQQRLALMLQDLGAPLRPGAVLVLTDRSLRLDVPEGQRRIGQLIERHEPDLVVFDPLARYMIGDENTTRDMGRVVSFADALIQRYGIAVELVHHIGKPSRDDPREGGQKLRGSSALFAAADSVLMLERQRGAFVLSFELRHAVEPEPLVLERTDRLWFQPAAVSEDLRTVATLAGAGS